MQFFGTSTWLAALLMLSQGCSSSSDVNRAVGARCSSERECDELCLTGSDFPDGFCSLRCTTDDDCPSNARCVQEQGGHCQIRCNTDDDCAYLGNQWECKTESNATGRVCRGD